MADIRNSISLTDHMTPTLRSVIKAMNSTLRVMDLVNKQSNQGVQSKAFRQAEKDIQRANNALIKMGNYSDLSSSRIQSSSRRSVESLNRIESAANAASRALSKVGLPNLGSKVSSGILGLQNLSPSNVFSAMQNKGNDLIDMSSTLWGKQNKPVSGNIFKSALTGLGNKLWNPTTQGIAGNLLKSVGTAGLKSIDILGKVGSVGSAALGKVGTAAKSFGSAFMNALDNANNRAKMTWQTMASGIYTIKSVISALSSLTALTDSVISDMAKLNLQNYSGTTPTQAYGMVYNAAQNSRSDISTTSTLASKIAMSGVYGQQKGSLESSINMAETLNKALVLGGGTQEENNRALTQLSQGLASGKLQGDELRSIREQSPYLAQMLAEGLTKMDPVKFKDTAVGDLKELGAAGELTASNVIKAFEAMEEQIDKTFDDRAPKTWGQGVTSIMNTVKFFIGILNELEGGPLQKITNLIWIIADYLNSPEGIKVLTGIATVLSAIGDILTFVVQSALNLVSWLMENSFMLIAIFVGLGVAATIAGIKAFIAWMAAAWPILLIIALVAIAIYIVMSFGVTTEQVIGAIAGAITWLVGLIYNCILAVVGFFVGLFNAIQTVWDNILIGCNNMLNQLVGDWCSAMATIGNAVLSLIELVNKLPGVNIVTEGVMNWISSYEQKAQDAYNSIQDTSSVTDAFKDGYDSMNAFQDGWSEEWFSKGYDWGSNLVQDIGNTQINLQDAFSQSSLGTDPFGTGGTGAAPVNVDGGNLDSVDKINSDVNIGDEDIKLLRDMAAREFLLQLQTVTPVANVQFGDVRETADVGKIVEVIEQMVEEQMATSLIS